MCIRDSTQCVALEPPPTLYSAIFHTKAFELRTVGPLWYTRTSSTCITGWEKTTVIHSSSPSLPSSSVEPMPSVAGSHECSHGVAGDSGGPTTSYLLKVSRSDEKPQTADACCVNVVHGGGLGDGGGGLGGGGDGGGDGGGEGGGDGGGDGGGGLGGGEGGGGVGGGQA